MGKVYLKEWKRDEDCIRLVYQDGSKLYVRYEAFNCAFGCSVSADKNAVQRNFSIE